MEEIRQEDIGFETRVFKITSMVKNETLDICIGQPYDHEGKDRYNVYRVRGKMVESCIGYYDVTKGEDALDESTKRDFDVKRYGEPTWTDKTKSAKSKPASTALTAPPASSKKSDFVVITTATQGDCFFDSIYRATSGVLEGAPNMDKIVELREEVAEMFREDDELKDLVVSRYRDSLIAEDDDTIPEIKYLLQDYYEGDDSLKDKGEIVAKFLEKLEESGVWVLDFIVATYMEKTNTQLIFFDSDSLDDGVENGTIIKAETNHTLPKYDDATKYIVLSYKPRTHYKLIAQADPLVGSFTWTTLPQTIKDLLRASRIAWYNTVEDPGRSKTAPPKSESKSSKAESKKSSVVEADDTPAEAKSESKLRKAESKKSSAKTKTILEEGEVDDDKESASEKKLDVIVENEPSVKATEIEEVQLAEPEGVVAKPAKKPRAKATDKVPPGEFDVENVDVAKLEAYTAPELKGILQRRLEFLAQSDQELVGKDLALSNKDKKELIECIQAPATCIKKTSAKKKAGGSKVNSTRRLK